MEGSIGCPRHHALSGPSKCFPLVFTQGLLVAFPLLITVKAEERSPAVAVETNTKDYGHKSEPVDEPLSIYSTTHVTCGLLRGLTLLHIVLMVFKLPH